MFPFGKKKNQPVDLQNPEDAAASQETAPQPKKGKMDKLIMGAILGVAVGSVVGAAVTSKKGQETIAAGKKMIEQKEAGLKKKKGLAGKFLGLLMKKKPSPSHQQPLPLRKIPHEHPAGDTGGKEKM